MKSILERLARYIGAERRNGDSARDDAGYLPREMRDARAAPYDPYAEMRKVLATTMLLG